MTQTTDPAPEALRTIRIIARLNVGGPARHTVILDAGLREKGWSTLLVHGQVADNEAEMTALADLRAVPRHYLPTLGRRIRPWDDLWTLFQLFRLFRVARPHVVHTHTAKAGALGRMAAWLHNALTRRSERAAIVHTFHGHVLEGYFGPWGNWGARAAERFLAALSDRIIVISEAQRQDLVHRFRVVPAAIARVIPLGLELQPLLNRIPGPSALRSELGFTADHFVVGYVGRFAPIKDLGTLIEAFRQLKAVQPDSRLLLVGDGSTRPEIEKMAQKLHVREAIQFLGWRDDLVEVYGAMDAFALTSRNEGTPVSLIEAMAAGIPVVATAVGGVPDVVTHRQSGLLVPPGEPAAVAAALMDINQDRAGAATCAARGRQVVANRFSPDGLVMSVSELYRSAIRDRRSRVERQS